MKEISRVKHKYAMKLSIKKPRETRGVSDVSTEGLNERKI